MTNWFDKSMNKNLILIGGGGHCKSVIDAAESSEYKISGILDLPENVGKSICGIDIVGTDDEIINYINKALFIVSVGHINDNSLRLKLYKTVKSLGGIFATIVASTAYVSKYAEIGDGSVILHQACINADAKIGVNCIVNTFANVEHDVRVGDHSHISTGVMINGGCIIGKSVFVGSQSTIKQGVSITDKVIIGTSSFVNKDISETGTYVGIPVHKLADL
jgi:sugar O-acyltransferase (sialic acid O-acetyltransferase NeuD family)